MNFKLPGWLKKLFDHWAFRWLPVVMFCAVPIFVDPSDGTAIAFLFFSSFVGVWIGVCFARYLKNFPIMLRFNLFDRIGGATCAFLFLALPGTLHVLFFQHLGAIADENVSYTELLKWATFFALFCLVWSPKRESKS